MTVSKTKKVNCGAKKLNRRSRTFAVSWSLASIICVFCSLSFASIAERATARDDFDATGDDDASYTDEGLSIDAGNQNVANPQWDINANAVWAVMFPVKMP